MKQNMKIRDIRATTVTVPLEAPLRHANGCHWGRFVRTIVEVETDTGLIGLGEMGGGGESAEAVFRAMKSYLVGHDPSRIEEMRFLIANPTASLYNNRTQILAALEFACLDILGQAWGVPVCEILGGRCAPASVCRLAFSAAPTGRTQGWFARSIRCWKMHARSVPLRLTSHKMTGTPRITNSTPHALAWVQAPTVAPTPSGPRNRPSVSGRRPRVETTTSKIGSA
jgi:L-alanine-DL-glutamate epimerase-like enolase superfamily enzyme